jgi:hypothetical protein
VSCGSRSACEEFNLSDDKECKGCEWFEYCDWRMEEKENIVKSNEIILTDQEKAIVKALNDHPYTVDFLQEWINRNDTVFINAPAALQATAAKGFYSAVRRLAQLNWSP